jgi:signal transduction histidine kinase
VTAQQLPSLRRQLVVRLVAFQAAALLLVAGLLVAGGVLLNFRSSDATIETLREAVVRNDDGSLRLRPTPEVAALRRAVPDLWFVVRDRQGQRLSEGVVPPEFATLDTALDRIGQARLGWNIGDPPRPTARMRWVVSPAGEIQIVTGSDGPLSAWLIGLSFGLLLLKDILPILLAMALATLVATPLVVRGALAGLDRAAAQARRIDVGRHGVQLPLDGIPREAAPLVTAINDALGRLDEGYERHRRFLTDAAHELRTPIAILGTRVASLPTGADKVRLQEDTARLSILAEQLLDLQRLDRGQATMTTVDLVALARQVVSDMAPLAFAAGYEMTFDADAVVTVSGDGPALERALTNLIQNAIDHGGRRGSIAVSVTAPATISVIDDGPGIPAAERERVFDPFHRLHPKGHGAGLGLHLVQEIMGLHGGRAVIAERPNGGTCMRLVFSR